VPVVTAGVIATIILAGGLAWWLRRRRLAASIPARLARAGDDLLANVLIPNAESGQIHIGYAVRTRQGIVVVDVRAVAGHVFGSESMHEWTVLAKDRRFTFGNPLPALYDRVAAVKRIVADVPVHGVVAFERGAEFTKGFPPDVAMVEGLLADLVAARTASGGPAPEVLDAAWQALRGQASTA
jgi:hypothetical protein